ncbi:enoyl-CoA hydratase/isomerase family protein [Xenophilus arseniciresistens]|uniref:Enoyl-CoA hydratase/isomerase family protein n=1 Tax=Xenophilus arseniciresistens TaxID=1283306 RepID=A0AAE3NF89_9BURK|nr:enoyl-CoA hydratase/isomerase family protein [Xenophilus arseniciresistens]MDA7419202.1 enoyl-CoA hydratase/isomerase family protein [Xenophilus arseniciresistens]
METLAFSVQEGIGWIQLSRPAMHNPVDLPLRADLMAVLEQVRNDPAVRVLVITGGAGAFCAGGNLHALQEHAQAGPAYWQRRIQAGLRLTDDLLNLGCPVIAAIDGPAIGAGFALALCADMIVATPRAKFAMAHLKLGLVPDLGALYLLPRVVGLQRAKELVFSTREIGVEEAHSLGLVMEVQASETLEARVRELAAQMAQAAPTAVALAKAMLNVSLDGDRRSAFALEAASQAAAFAAPEPAAQIEALLAKRAPAFTGLKPQRS